MVYGTGCTVNVMGPSDQTYSLPTKALEANFQVEALLGEGGFAHIVKATDAQGRTCALKLIKTCCVSLDDVEKNPYGPVLEARVHQSLSQEPSIVPCLDAFKTSCADQVTGSLVHFAVLQMPVVPNNMMEWLLSMSPEHQAGHISEDLVMEKFIQMVNAVRVCHQHGIIHKDIKLENFLIDADGLVRLTDFGLATVVGDSATVAGTPWTMSPAAFSNQDDGTAGDWWSTGIILYQLLEEGAWPFKHCWWPWQKSNAQRMEKAIRDAVLKGEVKFSSTTSQEARQMIQGLLARNTSERWALQNILCSPLVTPQLLQRLATKHPSLASDMQQLLQLQAQAVATAQASGTLGKPIATPQKQGMQAPAGLQTSTKHRAALVYPNPMHSLQQPVHADQQGPAPFLPPTKTNGSAGAAAVPAIRVPAAKDLFKGTTGAATAVLSAVGGLAQQSGLHQRLIDVEDCTDDAELVDSGTAVDSHTGTHRIMSTGGVDIDPNDVVLHSLGHRQSNSSFANLRSWSVTGSEKTKQAASKLLCGLKQVFGCACMQRSAVKYDVLPAEA